MMDKGIRRFEFFNGRIVPTRALMLAAAQQSMEFCVIELSGYGQPIFLSLNEEVHDLFYLKRRLSEYFERKQFDLVAGEAFFVKRRKGLVTQDQSYLQWQKPGRGSYRKDQPILGIFLSSPDELDVCGDQWYTPGSKDAAGFILELRELLSPSYLIVVRMHPNQDGDRTGKSKLMMDRLSKVDGVVLIKPRDPQSTYELMDDCRYVLTFGSTVGLEATYWGKVSVLVGRAIWEDANVTFNVSTPAELVDLLELLDPLCKELAVIVASYIMAKKDDLELLSWGDGGKYGFFVAGKSYLSHKRKGFAYWISRAIHHLMLIKVIC